MASKEATVYIVDCGKSMGERSHGRKQTNLDWALEYVWDRITATVATGRKTAMAGVVGLRTDDTENVLGTEDDYQHISTLRDIGQVLMEDFQTLRKKLVVSETNAGDAISALVIAIQMIVIECKKLKYDRKIVLVTDARGPMDPSSLADIVSKIKEDNISLVVLGVDFDDADYGFKEESKDANKAENEALLKQLCDACGGTLGTLAQAVDELGIPRVKSTKPVPNYKGLMTLGNPGEYDTALTIDVERYPKTMRAAIPSASKFVERSNLAAGESTQATMADDSAANGTSDGLTSVKNAMAYQIDDENAPGGKRDLDRDELSKGYEYGRTAVHISESDQNVVTYETSPGLTIIGFIDRSQYERYLDMNRANLIIAQRGNDKASMALSSFIWSLYELDSYAVARIVPKENSKPLILLLAPNIEPGFECLYDVELPFAEDMRSYKFAPLDRVVTVSGKELKVHRTLPTEDLQSAMDEYVDAMDLSKFGNDDEGNAIEYMPMDETYNPLLHRIRQVIKHRAVFPDTEPPPSYEILTRYSHPPTELVDRAQPALDSVISAANVKKVPPRAKGRRTKDAPKPLSDLDIGALLSKGRKNKRIDPENAIPEFKQILEASPDSAAVQDACKQLKHIIYDWIRYSVGNYKYGLVLEALGAMRQEMVELEFPDMYNEILRDLKAKVLQGDLGGERKELWFLIRKTRLLLVTAKEAQGGATDAEAEEFRLTR